MQFPVQMSDDFRISAHACKRFQSVWLASEVLSVSYIYIYIYKPKLYLSAIFLMLILNWIPAKMLLAGTVTTKSL